MALSMYQLTTPVFVRYLGVLSALLKKGQAHADQNGIPHQQLLNARLASDMHPLTKQVQIAADATKFAVSRLSGLPAPKFPDTETTFAQLQERIANTIGYLHSVSEAQLAGSAERAVSLNTPGFDPLFDGHSYLLTFALPNFYFHLTTAYDILRSQGVPLGKLDYLGPYQFAG